MVALHDDRDLSVHVTRAQFEEMCADLFERVTIPIDQVLEKANLGMQDIDAVEVCSLWYSAVSG